MYRTLFAVLMAGFFLLQLLFGGLSPRVVDWFFGDWENETHFVAISENAWPSTGYCWQDKIFKPAKEKFLSIRCPSDFKNDFDEPFPNVNLWNLLLRYWGIEVSEDDWGWYKSCKKAGKCDRGLCYSCEPNKCGGKEVGKDEHGCPLYEREQKAGWYACAGPNCWTCHYTYKGKKHYVRANTCRLVRAGPKDACRYYPRKGKLVCGSDRYYEHGVDFVYKKRKIIRCGGYKPEKYGRLTPEEANFLVSKGWKIEQGEDCSRTRWYSQVYIERMKEEWVEQILNKTVCWVEGYTLRYSGDDISHYYKVYGTPILYGDSLACKVKASDWSKATAYKGRPCADQILYDSELHFLFDVEKICKHGERICRGKAVYACEGGLKWVKVKDCRFMCVNGDCFEAPMPGIENLELLIRGVIEGLVKALFLS